MAPLENVSIFQNVFHQTAHTLMESSFLRDFVVEANTARNSWNVMSNAYSAMGHEGRSQIFSRSFTKSANLVPFFSCFAMPISSYTVDFRKALHSVIGPTTESMNRSTLVWAQGTGDDDAPFIWWRGGCGVSMR